VDVIFVEATVFGDLGTAGEDYARIDLENDVRRAGIAAGIVELVPKRLLGKDFLNAECRLIFRLAQIRNHLGSEFLIGQPN